MKKGKLLGYYNYTVVLTYIGMLTGFRGILCAFSGKLADAVLCLMIAGFCDMFDGAIASTMERTRQEKCFGIQIDSLSDLICFGVLPASICCNAGTENPLAQTVAGFYLLCALIRLAYFNVDEQERQRITDGCRELYYGMPVTLSALFIPLIYAIESRIHLELLPALTASLAIMGIAFLLPVPLRKPKIIGKICMLVWGLAEGLLVAATYFHVA